MWVNSRQILVEQGLEREKVIHGSGSVDHQDFESSWMHY